MGCDRNTKVDLRVRHARARNPTRPDLKGWRRQSTTGDAANDVQESKETRWQEEETERIRGEMKRMPYKARSEKKLGKARRGSEKLKGQREELTDETDSHWRRKR